jgi:phage-related tail fiber protein
MALAASGVVAGTYPVVTVDSKGRVTGGRALTAADVPVVDVSKITGAARHMSQAIANLLNGAPGALDTLQELAALGNDANFAATMTNALAGKVSLAQIQTGRKARLVV